MFEALFELYLTYVKPRIVYWTIGAIVVAFILAWVALAFGLIGRVS